MLQATNVNALDHLSNQVSSQSLSMNLTKTLSNQKKKGQILKQAQLLGKMHLRNVRAIRSQWNNLCTKRSLIFTYKLKLGLMMK